MSKLSIHFTHSSKVGNYSSVQFGAVKIYVAAVEVLKKEKGKTP